MTTADEDRIAARRAEAIRLRTSGKTIREIAEALGVGVATAHDDVRTAMSELAREAEENVRAERGSQLSRLERAFRVLEDVLEGVESVDSDDSPGLSRDIKLKALDRLVKLEERRAKLLGLDAPERREIDAKVAAVPLEDLDAMRAAARANECEPSPTGETTEEPGQNS